MIEQPTIYFTKTHPDAIIPKAHTDLSIGYDLHAIEDYYIGVGLSDSPTIHRVRTGLVARVEPQDQYHLEIVFRSSTPIKFPTLVLANHIGIVDPDYCGPEDEIMIILWNANKWGTWIKKGDRIAQLLIRKSYRPIIIEEKQHNENDGRPSRGGLGSTG